MKHFQNICDKHEDTCTAEAAVITWSREGERASVDLIDRQLLVLLQFTCCYGDRCLGNVVVKEKNNRCDTLPKVT